MSVAFAQTFRSRGRRDLPRGPLKYCLLLPRRANSPGRRDSFLRRVRRRENRNGSFKRCLMKGINRTRVFSHGGADGGRKREVRTTTRNALPSISVFLCEWESGDPCTSQAIPPPVWTLEGKETHCYSPKIIRKLLLNE